MKNKRSPQNSGSNTNAIVAAVLVAVVVFFAVIFYFYGPVSGPGSGPANPAPESQDMLEMQEALEWIEDCERRNPYIKDRCTDLFYYETAIGMGDEALCRKIENKGTKTDCIGYFNSVR